MIQREYYEELMKKKKNERHKKLTKEYRIARKNQKQSQKQIDQILKVNKKIATGPLWYQELSQKQVDIINNLGNSLKDDYNLNTTKNSRRMLRSLGVSTYIPHAVATKALYDSELHTVQYLSAIKNYLTQKSETSNDRSKIIHSHNEKKNNCPLDIRIIMSSIVLLAFDNLIEKLDYCLSEPKPDQTLELIKIPKSKKKPLNSFSPFLEPLPEPTIPWNEAEKIKSHNIKVKKQKFRENMKHKKEKLQKIEKMKNIELQMKMKYPEHPLKKLFFNPPIIKDFDYSKILPENNYLDTTITSHANGESNNVDDESTFSAQFLPIQSTNDVIKKGDTATVEKSLASEFSLSITFPVANENVNGRKPTEVMSELSVYSLPRGSKSNVDDAKKPYQWFKTDSLASSISLGFSYESSMNSSSEENVSKKLVKFDIGSMINTYNDQNDCHTIISKNDENINLSVEKSANLQSNKNNVDGGLSLGVLRIVPFSKMDSVEMKVLQHFKKHDDKYSEHKPKTRTPTYLVNVDSSADVTEETLEISTTSIELEMPSSKQDQNKRQERDDNELSDMLTKSKMNNDVKKISLDKKESFADLFPNKDDGDIATWSSPPSSKYGHDEQIAEPVPCNCMNETTDLDCILSELRQQPALKQLKSVLQLLSVLGDPIAEYPEIMELKMLRRWYERRLNINRHMTSKMKKNLINKSIVAWNSPRTKLSGVTIPQNPILPNKNAEKTTWDNVEHVKKMIEKTNADYIIELKHTAINNARQMYPSMENDNYKNRLSRNFKQTFFDYFPAKESDCLFGNPLTSYKIHKKNLKAVKNDIC